MNDDQDDLIERGAGMLSLWEAMDRWPRKVHFLNGRPCWCLPKYQPVEPNATLIIHRPDADHRARFEP